MIWKLLQFGLEEVLRGKIICHIASIKFTIWQRFSPSKVSLSSNHLGGHAIYIDAKTMLPHIPPSQYPGWTLSLVLYLIGGIRSVEIGSVMFGGGQQQQQKQQQSDNGSGIEKEEKVFAENELVRLAFPRRVYTQSHLDYLAEVILYINQIKDHIRGVMMVEPSPCVLRHFTAHFMPAHHDGNVDCC